MNKVLIFGLSGQVGDALLPLLRDASFRVTSISRQKKLDEQNIIWQQADFSNLKSVEKNYDAIISLGPLDAFVKWFLSSNIKTKKIIALSSTSIVTKKNRQIQLNGSWLSVRVKANNCFCNKQKKSPRV